MAEPCRSGGGGGMPKPNSMSTTTQSHRRGSASEQHAHERRIAEAQDLGGAVTQRRPAQDETPSRRHDTTSSTPPSTTKTLRSFSQLEHPQLLKSRVAHNDMDPKSLAADRKAYETCPVHCPVNKDSMDELETSRIVNNPKLRNDVNYDRELHFRPNLDGHYGQEKKKLNNRYWSAVGYEFLLVEDLLRQRADPTNAHRDAEIQAELKQCKKRLPHVFTAVRDILVSLVPEVDQQRIRERLDVDFLMQQIDNGVCDLKDLASWLAKIITTHCAPMRDALVEKMANTVIEASDTSQTPKLTDGLRQLVDIMEAMKLDVANHQIRHIRGHLIAGTVTFQKRYNAHRTKLGKIDVPKSRHWLEMEVDKTRYQAWPATMLDAFCSALLDSMAAPEPEFVPTLYLDKERLRGLSTEIHSYLCREICHGIMTSLLPEDMQIILKAWHMLQDYLMTINGSHSHFMDNVDNIAVQMSYIVAACTSQTDLLDATIEAEASNRLREDMLQDSIAYLEQQSVLIERLVPKLQNSVRMHINMTPLQLQDMLVPAPAASPRRASGFGAILEPARTVTPPDPDHTLIRKLTHIIVIHWQVWSDDYERTWEDRTEEEPTIESTDALTRHNEIHCPAHIIPSFAESTAQ